MMERRRQLEARQQASALVQVQGRVRMWGLVVLREELALALRQARG